MIIEGPRADQVEEERARTTKCPCFDKPDVVSGKCAAGDGESVVTVVSAFAVRRRRGLVRFVNKGGGGCGMAQLRGDGRVDVVDERRRDKSVDGEERYTGTMVLSYMAGEGRWTNRVEAEEYPRGYVFSSIRLGDSETNDVDCPGS